MNNTIKVKEKYCVGANKYMDMCPMMDYLANNKGVLYADILPTIYEGLQ